AGEGTLEIEAEAAAHRRAFRDERSNASDRQQRTELAERRSSEHLGTAYATAVAERARVVAPARRLRAYADAVEIHRLVVPEAGQRQHVVRAEREIRTAERVAIRV